MNQYEDETEYIDPEQLENSEKDSKFKFELLQKIENSFDWNLIGLISIWIFLFSTFFLLFVSQ
jgi:hypothetical protein